MHIQKFTYLQMLPTILIILCVAPIQSLADSDNDDQNLSNAKAIFNEIAKAHAGSEDQATLQNDVSLQEQSNLQESTNQQEQLQSQGSDPTKPDNFFDPGLVSNPLVVDEKDNTRLALTAIFINKNRKIAVINGVLLKEGEVIAGKKVQEITESKVKLIEKKDVLELRLPNYSIKKGAS